MNHASKAAARGCSVLFAITAIGCDPSAGASGADTEGDDGAEQITRVELSFVSDAGGAPIVAAFSDPDGDGGVSGTAEPITLAPDTTYALSIAFADELVDPPEDITAEIRAEAEEHQVFVYGGAVGDILESAYADLESTYGANAIGDDLPVGLSFTITTRAAGMGQLSVRLQHLPPINDAAVKVPGLAEAFPSIGGETDADVTFDVTVQ